MVKGCWSKHGQRMVIGFVLHPSQPLSDRVAARQTGASPTQLLQDCIRYRIAASCASHGACLSQTGAASPRRLPSPRRERARRCVLPDSCVFSQTAAPSSSRDSHLVVARFVFHGVACSLLYASLGCCSLRLPPSSCPLHRVAALSHRFAVLQEGACGGARLPLATQRWSVLFNARHTTTCQRTIQKDKGWGGHHRRICQREDRTAR